MSANMLKSAGIDNLDERLTRWEAFWRGEVHKRPPVTIKLCDDTPCMYGFNYNNPEQALQMHIRNVQNTLCLGDALPSASADFGPDQYAAWLGAELRFSSESDHTNWVVPFVKNWADVLPLEISVESPAFKRSLDLMRRLAAEGEGRFLVETQDLHSNLDALSAIRGPDNLSMDFYDDPENLKLACSQIGDTYEKVFLALEEAGRWKQTGYTSWVPVYSSTRFAVTECDYSCMVSKEMFDRYILPELRKEWSFLDRTIYHLDGTTALTHLPTLLAEPDVDAIQWISQAGQKPLYLWDDLFLEIRRAGKALDIFAPSDQIKRLHKVLGPEGCIYHVTEAKREEAEELLEWLEHN
ncbi:MAG: hypothetical protein GXY38_14340 [Planctomycetes bacterium]|nr:hypothetical protein [Planctomycetota bacterium]